MTKPADILRKNLETVESRIQCACDRAGRKRGEVTMVAITKYVDSGIARQLRQLGVRVMGESRPQELWKKAVNVPDAEWHLVGHLQRNKVAETLPHAKLIHSIDSVRLLEEVEAESRKRGRITPVLLEFNLSGEPAKHGFALGDVEELQPVFSTLRQVWVEGLMTMAALEATAARTRETFRALRRLREQFQATTQRPHSFEHLSMGMTNDFEISIEEGATLVRIGSALFEGLEESES